MGVLRAWAYGTTRHLANEDAERLIDLRAAHSAQPAASVGAAGFQQRTHLAYRQARGQHVLGGGARANINDVVPGPSLALA